MIFLSKRFISKETLVFFMFLFMIVFVFCGDKIVSAHGWKAPKKAAGQINPLESCRKIIDSGKEVYGEFCAYCHGGNARGTPKEENDLETDPPNLKRRFKMHSDGDAFWKIQQGNNDMPSFKEDLKEEEIWSVILYIKKM